MRYYMRRETFMPAEGAEGAIRVIRDPEHTIGSVIESIKSPENKNAVEANSLFIAKESLDVRGYEAEGGAFNEDLLRARAEQTVLPDGSRSTGEMMRDWFEAKKELSSAILDGKVDVGRPITQQNKEEAAYYKGLNITRQRENNPQVTESHITDPDENRHIFEKAAGELESDKARDLSSVVENWEDLVRQRAHQLSEVREGKQTQTQDLNEFLNEKLRDQREKPEGQLPAGPEEAGSRTEEATSVEGAAATEGVQPGGEGGPESDQQPQPGKGGPTEEDWEKAQEEAGAEPTGQATADQLVAAKNELADFERGLAVARGHGVEPSLEQKAKLEQLKAEVERLQRETAPSAAVQAEGAPAEKPPVEEKRDEEKEKAKEEKKQGFLGKVGGFFKNWWKSVSPQGRNKFYWGLGVGVGSAETLFIKGSLTPVVGPAASWVVSGVNALILNGLNYKIQTGITEAKANQDLEKLQKLETQYKKTADFFAGVAAGSIGTAVGGGLWNGLVSPRLPEGAGVGRGISGITDWFKDRFGIGGGPGGALLGEVAAPPSETEVTAPKAELTPWPEEATGKGAAVLPVAEVAPIDVMKYVVKPGDTITDILFNNGHSMESTYGRGLTDFIIRNADVLKERALDNAQRQAIDQVLANPDWLATDDKEKWKVIMRAGHWIFPGQSFNVPLPKAA